MNFDLWLQTKKQFLKICHKLRLDPLFLTAFLEFDRLVEVSLPMKMDNGQIKVFTGYRVQHNNFCGPYKGGLRYHPQVSISEMKTLAFLMTLKTALLNLPFGGAKGGIAVEPKKLSAGELERLTRFFTQKMADFIGPEKDIPAPDVNTNPLIMSWIADEYRRLVGKPTPAVVTGKPLEGGGSEGRLEATGLGGSYVLLEALRQLRKKPKDLTVAIQGFGNVGKYIAYFLQKAGLKIVALADSKGGIYVPQGIRDLGEVERCKEAKGSLAGCYSVGSVCDLGNHNLPSEKVLELPVDILIPAAIENVLTKENASRIKAKIILEMANGPTTPEAELILKRRKVILIPDILANSGGVVTSFFEWQQNIKGEHWSQQKVFKRLKEKMEEATNEVFALSKKRNVDLREAAYFLALKRLKTSWQKQK